MTTAEECVTSILLSDCWAARTGKSVGQGPTLLHGRLPYHSRARERWHFDLGEAIYNTHVGFCGEVADFLQSVSTSLGFARGPESRQRVHTTQVLGFAQQRLPRHASVPIRDQEHLRSSSSTQNESHACTCTMARQKSDGLDPLVDRSAK